MFLYWKKRGAYELGASPPPLTEERYSWSSSSSLDGPHNLSGKQERITGLSRRLFTFAIIS